MTSIPANDLSRDAFLGGRITVWQPRTGFRSGMDAVFLAAAVPARAGDTVLDLGCGAGAAARCQLSQSLGGGQSRHCHWTFPYRSAEASAAFTEILDAVSTCLGPNAAVIQDQDVSHPDTYDLHLFERNGTEFAVSLKDKAALAQTLIFLRLPIEQ